MGDERVFLGVDGGQSATQAVIGDASGSVLARAAGGPCNHAGTQDGRVKLRRVAGALVAEALQAAGLRAEAAFESACFAMSGGPDDKVSILRDLVAARKLEVVTDADAALEGAAAGGAGIAVIAGTGSIALARDADGNRARCGGWGYLFGDEGGGFDIARRALQRVLAAEEGWGEPTRLRAALLDAAEARSANEALHRFYTPEWPRDRVAGLARTVDRVAEGGDRVARAVLESAGEALGSLAERAAGRLSPRSGRLDAYPVGGVFRSRSVGAAFARRMESAGLRMRVPAHDAAVGALLRAYRLNGMQVNVRENG